MPFLYLEGDFAFLLYIYCYNLYLEFSWLAKGHCCLSIMEN